MSNPPNVTLPLASMVSLGVEHWRLTNCFRGVDDIPAAGPVRHALRRIGDLLRECELEVVELSGRPFDPGMAAEVIDRVEDDRLPAGQTIVEETLSPLILWRGQVIKPAQIVTRAGVGEAKS